MSEQLQLFEQDQNQTEDNKLSYEEAVAELEAIVRQLEKGEAKLEESGRLYERGIMLSKYCADILNAMEESLTKLSLDEEGLPREEELKI